MAYNKRSNPRLREAIDYALGLPPGQSYELRVIQGMEHSLMHKLRSERRLHPQRSDIKLTMLEGDNFGVLIGRKNAEYEAVLVGAKQEINLTHSDESILQFYEAHPDAKGIFARADKQVRSHDLEVSGTDYLDAVEQVIISAFRNGEWKQ